MKLVVADDDPERLRVWKERLAAIPAVEREFTVEGLQDGELGNVIEKLEARRVAGRNQKPDNSLPLVIDDADVLLIDYDLSQLEGRSSMTGLDIAYLARCFSSCGYIVALNQFGENVFDLSLSDHPEGFADLDLGGAQLDNPGLWEEPSDVLSFRPWAWPMIPRAAAALERRTEMFEGRLEERVWSVLGFDDHAFPELAASVTRYLSSGDPTQTTVEEFLEKSGFALRIGDRQSERRLQARIAAARLAKWIELLVLPGQDILVDAPHLATRFPSQLSSPINWDATARSVYGDEAGLHAERLDRYRFDDSLCLSRPAWWWQECSEDETIPEVSDPFASGEPEVVFCEDTSRFVKPEDVRPFRTELNTPFASRFVEGPSGPRAVVQYHPASFFAL